MLHAFLNLGGWQVHQVIRARVFFELKALTLNVLFRLQKSEPQWRTHHHRENQNGQVRCALVLLPIGVVLLALALAGDRKSTRLNSSHVAISYAVFCLKKKNKQYGVS